MNEIKKETMKEKFGKFWEKNGKKVKNGIAIGAGAVCTAAGVVYLMKGKQKPDYMDECIKNIFDVLYDVENTYGKGGCSVFTGFTSMENGITISELGELGEKIMQSGAEIGTKFTHFIAIGEKIK